MSVGTTTGSTGSATTGTNSPIWIRPGAQTYDPSLNTSTLPLHIFPTTSATSGLTLPASISFDVVPSAALPSISTDWATAASATNGGITTAGGITFSTISAQHDGDLTVQIGVTAVDSSTPPVTATQIIFVTLTTS